jgi:hypothetical protein
MLSIPQVQSTNSNTTNTSPVGSTATTNQPVQNTFNANAVQPQNNPANAWGTPAPAPNNGSGWGDGFNDYWGNSSGGWGSPAPANNTAQKKLTPEERVQMIEKVYLEVLNRKPDTRDINYYKYSTLAEDEIRKQLIQGKEHKDLLEHGKEYSNLKSRTDDAETRVKMLEGQIKDQLEEFRKLTDLLKEKNRYIEQLRRDLNNPLNLPQHALTALRNQESMNSTQHFTETKKEGDSTVKSTKSEQDKVTFMDRIINAFGG